MKLNKWLFGAAALVMTASCSDNFDGKAPTEPVDEGENYISINIKLPTVSGTRADEDDFDDPFVDFNDGELEEYYIMDAALALFQGADEATAKYIGSFNLQEAGNISEDTEHDQITRHSIRIASVSGVDHDDDDVKLYGLVMCNGIANNMYTAGNPKASWMKKESELTIRDFQEYVQKNATPYVASTNAENVFFQQQKKGKGYATKIFMTNAPLSTRSAEATNDVDGQQITGPLPVLVELDKTTYPTKQEALQNPAGIIHVERAVAKVTCSKFEETTSVSVTVGGKSYKLKVKDIWWDMAQDMADSYLVRNTNRNAAGTDATDRDQYLWKWHYASTIRRIDDGKLPEKRMLGNDPLVGKQLPGGGNEVFYRAYFCQVPGYGDGSADPDGIKEKKTFTKETMIFDAANTVKWDNRSAFYPLENTFPVEYMKYANTTRIGFWVTFTAVATDGSGSTLDLSNVNFYIKEVDKSVLYLDDADGNDPLTNLALADLTDSANRGANGKYGELWTAINSAVPTEGETAGSITVDLKDLLKFEYEDTADGSIEIKKVSFKTWDELTAAQKTKYEDLDFDAIEDFDFSQYIAKLNSLGQYYKYDAGRAFYEVRVKHFGDNLTPWSDPEYASTIDESYGTVAAGNRTEFRKRNNNYLGRYGVVRNNWYDLQVNSVKTLGDPQDPARWDANWPGKPDDNKDQYIAVELRVLSWAKRIQGVDFE